MHSSYSCASYCSRKLASIDSNFSAQACSVGKVLALKAPKMKDNLLNLVDIRSFSHLLPFIASVKCSSFLVSSESGGP